MPIISMSTSEVKSVVEPAHAAIAKRLAKQVLECDPAVLSLMVLDKKGQVLAVDRSVRLPEGEYIDDDALPKLAVVAKLIMGAAANVAEYTGRIQFLVGGFKNQKVLLIDLQEYDMVLAMRLARSANAEYVSNKIGETLGTTS